MIADVQSADTSAKVKLTKKFCDGAGPGRDGKGRVARKVFWDIEQPNFALMVMPPNSSGSSVKSFIVQRYVAGKSMRVTLGRYGHITLEQGRKLAREALGKMAGGGDPVEEKRRAAARGITLGEAWALYRGGLVSKNASARTLDNFDGIMRLYFTNWLNRPLADITRQDVQARHQKLADEIRAGKFGRKGRDGKQMANAAFRLFRGIYNRAMRQHPELPANPSVNIDWFKATPPRTAIPSTALAAWGNDIRAINDSVRRDFLLFALFTGLRRQTACEVEWSDVDFENRKLRIPKPKGGEERAFDIPLSDYLLELLERRQRENAQMFSDTSWIFPGQKRDGTLTHFNNFRTDVSGVAFTLHDLRRTFITVAQGLDVSEYALKALVNHAQPRHDVTAGYVTIEFERLRKPMQEITDKLRALIGGERHAETA